MPFVSRSQMRAAFGGHLGKEMKMKAEQWASETPNIKDLPEHRKQSNPIKGLKAAKPKRKH